MTRIALRVEIDLDALPGQCYQASDWLRILRDPNGLLPSWYHPTVELIVEPHEHEISFPKNECRICGIEMTATDVGVFVLESFDQIIG